MSKPKQMIALSVLALTYGIDLPYLCKMVKQAKIETVDALTESGNACNAITEEGIAKLEKAFPQLNVGTFNADKHITVKQMAAKLGVDDAGLHKTLRKAGFAFIYLRVPTERVRTIKRKDQAKKTETVICSGRPTPCLTLTDFAKYQAKHPARIKV